MLGYIELYILENNGSRSNDSIRPCYAKCLHTCTSCPPEDHSAFIRVARKMKTFWHAWCHGAALTFATPWTKKCGT